MRHTILTLLLMLAGCLAVQDPHNPTTHPEVAAPVASATEAPVVSAEPVAPPALPPLPALPPPPALPAPILDLVGLMKEMFLVQKDLNQQILKMADELSDAELAAFNLWLRQHGVQIQKRRTNPNHDHNQGRGEGEVY